MLSVAFYHIAHLVGVILLFVGFGGLLSGDPAARKRAMMFHGIGLVVLLVAGFGLIARLQLPYTAPFIIAKLVIFVVLGGLPALTRRMSPTGVVFLAIILGGFAAYLGYLKAMPF